MCNEGCCDVYLPTACTWSFNNLGEPAGIFCSPLWRHQEFQVQMTCAEQWKNAVQQSLSISAVTFPDLLICILYVLLHSCINYLVHSSHTTTTTTTTTTHPTTSSATTKVTKPTNCGRAVGLFIGLLQPPRLIWGKRFVSKMALSTGKKNTVQYWRPLKTQNSGGFIEQRGVPLLYQKSCTICPTCWSDWSLRRKTNAPKTVPKAKSYTQTTAMQLVCTETIISTVHTWTSPFRWKKTFSGLTLWFFCQVSFTFQSALLSVTRQRYKLPV